MGLFLVRGISGVATLGVAALAGATLTLMLGCITPHEAYRGVEWRVALLLGAVFPVAQAVSSVVVTHAMAAFIVREVGGNPAGTVLALFILGAVLTQVLSNIATAALLTPVAVFVARAALLSIHALVVTLLAARHRTQEFKQFLEQGVSRHGGCHKAAAKSVRSRVNASQACWRR